MCSDPQAKRFSVPVLDGPVPAGGCNLGCFVWIPRHVNAHLVMRLDLRVKFRRAPVPHTEVSVGVTTDEIRAIGREVHLAGIAGHGMAFEGLLSVLAETVAGTKHEDLVVQALRTH